jgi:hypothetical protein
MTTTKFDHYILSVAALDGVLKTVCVATKTETVHALTDQINRLVKTLVILKFRGAAIFQIATDAGDLCWTSVVTFTDDNPEGFWETTNHHFQGQ